jgi:hypothetical protein
MFVSLWKPEKETMLYSHLKKYSFVDEDTVTVHKSVISYLPNNIRITVSGITIRVNSVASVEDGRVSGSELSAANFQKDECYMEFLRCIKNQDNVYELRINTVGPVMNSADFSESANIINILKEALCLMYSQNPIAFGELIHRFETEKGFREPIGYFYMDIINHVDNSRSYVLK